MNRTERIKQLFKKHFVSLLLIGLIAYIWFRPPATVTEVNQALPNLPFTTLDGRMGTLQSLRGKVVLVNFWATWCPYCRKEMPAIQKFYQEYQGRGFEVLAFSTDDDPAKAARYMREAGYTFPAAMADTALQQAFGPIEQIPMSMIIDRDGRLRHRIKGQVYYGRIEDLVQPLLAPTVAPRSPR
jgi:thiol-disulfide isomerase/thioredoxin